MSNWENMWELKQELDIAFDDWLAEDKIDKKELCENCRQYRVLEQRKFDGLMLCKKCHKNKSLKMFKDDDLK